MSDTSEARWICDEILTARLIDIDINYHPPGIHRDGRGDQRWWELQAKRKLAENAATRPEDLTWDDLLVADTHMIRSAETDETRREALLQMAATIVANISDIDRRSHDRAVLEPSPKVFLGGLLAYRPEDITRGYIPLREINLIGANA